MKKVSIDVAVVKKEAEKEVHDERLKAAKEKVKAKLRALANAKKVVANMERELQDCYDDMGQDG